MLEYSITLATWCTLTRLLLIPFLVLSIMKSYWAWAIIIFCIAATTDFLDGYIARKRNECTVVGAVLDAFTDKIFIMATLLSLALKPCHHLLIPNWLLGLCIVKEIVQIIGSLFLIMYGYVDALKPTILGKVCMTVQIAFVLWVLVGPFLVNPTILLLIHNYIIGIVALITGICFIHYAILALYVLLRPTHKELK